jgi:hypothetical protein
MAVSTSLLYDKMEEFRATTLTAAIWTNPSGSETLVVSGERYIRAWRVGAGSPRSVTVIVYVQSHLLTRRTTELVRATTLVSPTF